MVMSHLGRPKEGVALQDQTEVSLAPVAKVLEQLLGHRCHWLITIWMVYPSRMRPLCYWKIFE